MRNRCNASCTTVFIALIVGIIIGLLLDLRSCSGPVVIDKWHYDTTYITKAETVVVVKPVRAWRVIAGATDTVIKEVPVTEVLADTNCKPFRIAGDTVRLQDSALVVPKFSYPEGTFDIWYRPPVQRVITATHEQTIYVPPKDERYGLGIGFSYGPTLTDGKVVFAPQLSIGLYYKLLGR